VPKNQKPSESKFYAQAQNAKLRATSSTLKKVTKLLRLTV